MENVTDEFKGLDHKQRQMLYWVERLDYFGKASSYIKVLQRIKNLL